MSLPVDGAARAEAWSGLEADQLDRVFPFHLRLDAEGRLLGWGPALAEACPGLSPGLDFFEAFILRSAGSAAELAQWRHTPGRAVHVQTRRRAGLSARRPVLALRGSVEPAGEGVLLLLVPLLHSLTELASLGLDLSDLPAHDSSADLVLVRRAGDMALAEAEQRQLGLRERVDQLEQVLELSDAGLLHFDVQERLRHCNRTLEQLVEMPRAELIGRPLIQIDSLLVSLLAGDQAGAGDGPLRRLLNAQVGGLASHPGATVVLDLALPLRKRVLASVNVSAQGEPVFFLQDVTLESEVDRMKSDFLSNAAHELRTPMVSVFGFTELLLSRTFPPDQQRDMIETIHRQAGTLVQLVNELLDLSRIEARRGQDFRLSPAGLLALTRKTVAGLLVPGDSRRVTLQLPAEEVLVRVDPEKFGLALTNVLSNAYKYSAGRGDIVLGLRRTDLDGRPSVTLEVVDQGIGMTPGQLRHLFERFWRADPSGHIPGTGLGMCLVREIMTLHGGRVDVDSQPGIGTRVSLTLPVCTDPVTP